MSFKKTALEKRVSGLEESEKQFEQRRGDMERAGQKAVVDREKLRKELEELEGRSAGNAEKAAEVRGCYSFAFFFFSLFSGGHGDGI